MDRLYCDANVLYSSLLRDLLIRLALADVAEVRWSREIQQEWLSNLLTHQPQLDAARLERTVLLMERALPDALVQGYEALMPGLTLPDEDDLHVLAAAIHADATHLLTFNLRDFPVNRGGLQIVHPDVWLHRCLEQWPLEVVKVVSELAADLKQPPLSAVQVAQALGQLGLPVSAAALLGLLAASD